MITVASFHRPRIYSPVIQSYQNTLRRLQLFDQQNPHPSTPKRFWITGTAMDDSQEHRILTEPLLSSADSCIRDVASQDDLTNTKISESERTEASTVTVEEDDLEEPNNEYVLDPSRFAVLGVFSLANVLASAAWITFAPIDDVIMEMYDISLQKVNWLSLIFMALYGPGTAVCAWAIRIYGLRMTVVVSAIVMALGGMLRWWSVSFVHENHHGAAYAILLIGQGLIAMAQPVVSNAPARVASAWFQQTAGAIGFVVFGSMVGLVLGQSMSPWMMGSINALLAGQALAMVVCSIATIVYFKSEPKSPPTLAEALRRRQTLQGHQTRDPEHHQPNQSSSTSIWFEMKLLLSDTQYLVLLLSFGIGYGVNNALLTLLQPWIASAGFPGDDLAGWCGALGFIGGMVATFVAAPLLDHTRAYNQAVRWSFLVAFLVMVGVIFVLQPNSKEWVLITAFFLMGMSQFPLLPICLDAAAAHTYPISEELSSAGLQFVGQYLGIAMTDGMEYLLKHQSIIDGGNPVAFAAPLNIAILALMLFSAVVAFLYSGEDRRAVSGEEHRSSHGHRADEEG